MAADFISAVEASAAVRDVRHSAGAGHRRERASARKGHLRAGDQAGPRRSRAGAVRDRQTQREDGNLREHAGEPG